MKFIKYWLPVIIYAILIFYVSSIPGEDIPPLFARHQILFHIIEYGIFAILLSRALKESYPSQGRIRRAFLVVISVIIYAISDEFHQSFVPNRFSSVYDVFIDGIGSFIGSIIYYK